MIFLRIKNHQIFNYDNYKVISNQFAKKLMQKQYYL